MTEEEGGGGKEAGGGGRRREDSDIHRRDAEDSEVFRYQLIKCIFRIGFRANERDAIHRFHPRVDVDFHLIQPRVDGAQRANLKFRSGTCSLVNANWHNGSDQLSDPNDF